jgi:hypothetical protein
MSLSDNKTLPTAISVAEYIAGVPDERRREEAHEVDAIMRRVTGEEPVMWGPSIIGYGEYHYRYDSGREGDMCRIGFSPRKAQLVLYLGDATPNRVLLLARLGKHKLGAGCLYLTRLDGMDLAVLEEICAAAWTENVRRFP